MVVSTLQTNLNTQNTSPWAVTTYNNNLYVANRNNYLYSYSGVPIIVVLTATWSSVSYTGGKLTGTLTFSGGNASGISASDFEILNASDVVQTTGWTFDTPPTTLATSGTGITISVTPPTNLTASFKIRLKATSVRGGAAATDNSPGTAVTTSAIAIDSRPALVVSSFALKSSSTTSNSTATREFELDFDRDIDANQLTSADFTISNSVVTFGSISPSTGTEDTYTITVNQPANAHGSYTITLAQNAIPAKANTYKTGPSSISTTTSTSFDRRNAITATWTEPTGTQTGATAAFTLTFGQSVPASQLTSTDFTVTNGGSVAATGAISPTSGNQTVYTITVTQPTNSNGSYTVSLNADAISTGITYLEGPDSVVQSSSVSYDTRVRVLVSSDTLPSTTQTGATVAATITFNRSIAASELSVTDFTLTNGATIAITQTSGNHSTFNLTITQPTNSNGTYTVSLKANAISAGTGYLGGPLNVYSLGTVTYDTRSAVTVTHFRPKLTTTAAQNAATREFELDLNKDVLATQLTTRDFSVSDTNITIASISPTSGNEDTYTITANQPNNRNGSYTITLAQNAIANGTSYLQGPASAYTSVSASFDRRSAVGVTHFRPKLTTSAAQQASTRELELDLDKDITASELTDADFVISNAAITWSSISPTTGNEDTYTITVNQPNNTHGSYTIQLRQNAIPAKNNAYLQSPTSPYTSTSASFDTRTRVSVSSDTLPSVTQTGATVAATITFDRSIAASELSVSDFTLTNGATIAITQTSGNHSTFNLTITQPTNSSGTYTVSLNANVIPAGTGYLAGPLSAYSLGTVTYDTRSAVTVSSDTLPGGSQTGATISGSITFDRSVPLISTSNFTLSAGTIAITETTGPRTTYNFTITQPTNSSGSYTVSFNQNAVSTTSSYLQGPTSAYSLGTVIYDTRRAITATWTEPTGTQTGTTSSLTLTFNHQIPAIQLVSGDFVVSGSLSFIISPTTGNSATYTITVTHTTNTSSNYTVSLNADAVATGTTYLEGPDSAATSSSVVYDTRVRVGVSSDTLPSTTQTGATVTATITFDQIIAASALSSSDFTLTDGATIAISPTTGSQDTYNLTITQPTSGNGTYTISLNANAIPAGTGYLSGPVNPYSLGTVTYDRRSAVGVTSFALKSPSTTSSSTATREFILDFDQDIDADELSSSDFTISNTAVTFNSISPTTGTEDIYTLTVNQPANAHGSYTITLGANAVPDKDNAYKAGPSGTSVTTSTSFDRRTAISVSSALLPTGSQTGSTITGSITFSLAIPATQLTNNDFTLTGGAALSLTSVSGSNTSYSFSITQPTNSSGSYTVSLNQNAISTTNTYLQGPASAYSLGTVTYDTRSAITASWTEPTGTQTGSTSQLTLTLNHSVPATQITSADFTVSDGLSFTISPTTGNSATYTITVTHTANTSSDYTITFAANAVGTANTYLQGPTSSVISSTISYDSRERLRVTGSTLPTTTLSNPIRTRTFTGSITFDRSILATQLTSSDFTLGNGITIAISPTTGSQTTYTLTFTQPSNSSGNYSVSLNQNSIPAGTGYLAGPLSAYSLGTIFYDTRPPVVARATWTNVSYTGGKLQGTLTFNERVTGISASDFVILDSEDGSQGDWTFDTPSTTATANIGMTIAATPPSNVVDLFKIRIRGLSVIGPRATSANSPSAAVTTNSILIDSRPPIVATATWSAVSYTGTKLQGTLTFNNPITGLSTSDFEIVASDGSTLNWTFDSVSASCSP